MSQRDRESGADSEAQGLFFGSDDDSLLGDHPDDGALARPTATATLERPAEKRGKGRFIALLVVLLVGVVAVAAWLVVLPAYRYFNPADYSGSGSGNVLVTVRANDGAGQIGDRLHRAGVVASTRAFTDAANANSKSQNIQPGSYRLHKHMAAVKALGLLLNPSARLNSDILVPEGATLVDIEKKFVAPLCGTQTSPGAACGLGLTKAAVTRALRNISAVGLPTDYRAGGKLPLSLEGFLYPATYPIDDSTGIAGALQQMVTKFTDEAKTTNFTALAKANGLTPYQQLIIASIAQGEAKYGADMPKVARVILNRIKLGRNLQIDATSAYAAKLKGIDPTKTIYSATQGPYNSYTHAGLPPTPIGNPGAEAMTGAAHPATGNWIYYVNADKAGHLFFTNNEKAFIAAKRKCAANGWGCAAN